MKTWFAMVSVEEPGCPAESSGTNWNTTDSAAGLLAQHQCLSSLMLLWMNEQNPTAMLYN